MGGQSLDVQRFRMVPGEMLLSTTHRLMQFRLRQVTQFRTGTDRQSPQGRRGEFRLGTIDPA